MSFCFRFALLLGAAYCLVGKFSFAVAEELPAKSAKVTHNAEGHKFVRILRNDKKEPVKLQTAAVTFKKADQKGDVTIDLIGAVHVGDKSYYDALNATFANYDVVLYELVAPEGTRIPKGHKARNNHFAGAVQNGMKDVLSLRHQLEEIDYTSENMVHADMSPEEFSKSMSDRGESFLGMMFRFMGQSMAQQSNKGGQNSDAQMFMALFSKDRDLALKRVLAEQFEDLEQSMAAFNGEKGSAIITERNKRALEKLAAELQASKKRIAIFYGAGHMPDFEQRLVADFGMKRATEKWFDAWDLAAVQNLTDSEK